MQARSWGGGGGGGGGEGVRWVRSHPLFCCSGTLKVILALKLLTCILASIKMVGL